ncbi:peptidase family C50-domain-containing protein [Mycotypha africana]|uniref:peptidase family C50-domain-containing protein n=1 Tax=Mycotypha africana TaxID=64632 RepID=UPI002300EB95|nr:peptidase family C50-domain-containing protein [Mycotypha africana]KAI8979428.1 peptidase family C50-domain-containing protein [Mycotypha africana]
MYRNSKITNEWPSIEEEDDDEEQKTTFLSLKRTTNPEWLQKHLRDVSDKYCNEYMLDAHQFQDEFIDILPSNWTVCSLTFDPESELLFAMQLRASESPLIFKLPLNRAKTRTGSKHSYTPYNYALSELKQIIQESDDTIFNSHNKDMTDPNVIAAWWDTRKKLDSRLKDLLRNMEEHWFSGFKGLLSGRAQESESELISFQQNFIKSAHNIVKERLKPQKKIEYSLNFCRMVLRLGSQPVAQDLEDIAFFILSTYEVPDELIDRKILEKLTKEVKTHIAQYYEMCRRQDIDATKNRPGEHVILILDKHLQMLPIESMPILRPQPASRLPSLSLLRDRILFTYANNSQEAYADFGVIKPKEWKDHTVSKKDAFYVLNPAGDLQETQKRLDPLLKSVPQWDGVTQKSPSEIECINALRTKDIYMYFGHGAGQSYLRGNMVKQLPICSTSLLMGCSSGLLKSNGEFDPYGYVLNYLVAGR